VVAHETFLYPDLTASENLSYYARLYRVRDVDRARALLVELGLADVADRPVRTFSRGMSQRLALARAMLHRPELLILDEPLSGLDPGAAAIAERMLLRVRTEGITLLFTSHDFDAAARIAGRAVLVDRGRLVWDSGDGGLSPEAARGAFGRLPAAT
jgi:heme exporter protein A